LANDYGDTIAHIAAKYNHLPPDFDQWELTNKEGKTVVRIAYVYKHLPSNFDRWDLIFN
jgi:thioester reductase-like protein